MILVAITIYIPFVLSGYYSLTEGNGISKGPTFIGLENFRQIFSGSPDFLKALWFTARYAFFFILFTNVLALALAVALTKKFRIANVLRGMFFVPYIMSMTIVAHLEVHLLPGIRELAELTGWGVWNLSWLATRTSPSGRW